LSQWSELLRDGVDVLAWFAATAAVGSVAIQTPYGPQLSVDMPVLLAAGYLFGPIPAGLVAFGGYVDLRELRGEIGVERALFNRAQTSLSVMAASAVFALGDTSMALWPEAALWAMAAVGIDCLVNYGLVASVMTLSERVPPRSVLSRLQFGPVAEFAITYLSFGLVSLLLAEVYVSVGIWGVLLFATPLVLARQALANRHLLDGAERRVRVQGAALRQVEGRFVEERRDERLSLAAGLHDDVLPPIVKVHLLGQVLRQELATGQLLLLEDDLPALLRATDEASVAVRQEIRSLRTSGVGVNGLTRALELLAGDLGLGSTSRFTLKLDTVSATPMIELLTYQVAREAMRNATRHANASMIVVQLTNEVDSLRLTVSDDGRGFDPRGVDDTSHFGLALMRERVELAGGWAEIRSESGGGTTVEVRLPTVRSIKT
jgi:signal transduction histidine kinase